MRVGTPQTQGSGRAALRVRGTHGTRRPCRRTEPGPPGAELHTALQTHGCKAASRTQCARLPSPLTDPPSDVFALPTALEV